MGAKRRKTNDEQQNVDLPNVDGSKGRMEQNVEIRKRSKLQKDFNNCDIRIHICVCFYLCKVY